MPNGSLTAYDCGYIIPSLAVFAAYGPSETATKTMLKKFMQSVDATEAADDRITERTAEYYRELNMSKIKSREELEQEKDDEDVTLQ